MREAHTLELFDKHIQSLLSGQTQQIADADDGKALKNLSEISI